MNKLRYCFFLFVCYMLVIILGDMEGEWVMDGFLKMFDGIWLIDMLNKGNKNSKNRENVKKKMFCVYWDRKEKIGVV